MQQLQAPRHVGRHPWRAEPSMCEQCDASLHCKFIENSSDASRVDVQSSQTCQNMMNAVLRACCASCELLDFVLNVSWWKKHDVTIAMAETPSPTTSVMPKIFKLHMRSSTAAQQVAENASFAFCAELVFEFSTWPNSIFHTKFRIWHPQMMFWCQNSKHPS